MKRLFFLFCVAATMSTAGIALAIPLSPPVITRIGSSEIGHTTASVNMTYTSNAPLGCRWWFDVSTHSDLSGAHKEGEVGSSGCKTGSGSAQTQAQLSGLTPGTVYFYRAYMRNDDGERYSAIKSFRTGGGPPSVKFDDGRMSTHAIELDFTCNGYGAEGHCLVMWSTSAGMSGERELKGNYVRPTQSLYMHATFGLSSVPDNTRVYIQAVMKTQFGTAKTGVHDFLIRHTPI